MFVSIDVIGKEPDNDTSPLNLKTAPSTVKGTGEYLVAFVGSATTYPQRAVLDRCDISSPEENGDEQ